MRAAEVIRRRDGIARTATLYAAGVSRGEIRRSLAAESIERVREGVYAVPGCPPDVRRAADHGGEVACVSALRRRGVWVLEDGALHVWVGPKGRRHRHAECRCVTHRDEGAAAFGVVSIIRALVQVARCQGAEGFFVAFESAWRQGLLSAADRREIRSALPAGQRWLVDFARPHADSGLESLLRLRLRRHGITLESQVVIGNVGRVDFVLDGAIILEVDGRLNHDGPSLRHKDLVRDAAASAQGYETLRFDYALVVHDWPRVEAAILAARLRASRRINQR